MSLCHNPGSNIGVFGDQAKDTGIPCEVFRYYLIANRPEQQDSNFMWADLADKNNNELLKNIGNFSVRVLKFIYGHYDKTVPDFTESDPESKAAADECLIEVYKEFQSYVSLMEGVKLREAIKQAMNISSICNKYMQKWEPWVVCKKKPILAASTINILMNVFILTCAVLEPFIPTFAAKVYDMVNWKRGVREETLLGYIFDAKDYKKILSIVPPKHVLGEIFPIFRESTIPISQPVRSHRGGDRDAQEEVRRLSLINKQILTAIEIHINRGVERRMFIEPA